MELEMFKYMFTSINLVVSAIIYGLTDSSTIASLTFFFFMFIYIANHKYSTKEYMMNIDFSLYKTLMSFFFMMLAMGACVLLFELSYSFQNGFAALLGMFGFTVLVEIMSYCYGIAKYLIFSKEG